MRTSIRFAGLLLATPAAALHAQQPLVTSVAEPTVSAPPVVVPSVSVGEKGIMFTSPDGGTKLALRARLQNLAEITTVSTRDLAAQDVSMAPRRVRLRLDGSVFDPRLTIKLQLSFSRRDQDYDDTQAANVVRDAAAYWRFNPSLQVGYGQTKLPTNRQRVVSSGDLQFAERSLVNSRFAVDRDEGLFARVDRKFGHALFNLQYALSLGEGRNQPRQGAGLANTVRAEVMPLGAFTQNNDYIEGDLFHEAHPRLSIGVSYSTNSRTTRTSGQTGQPLWAPRTMNTLMADAVLKYRGTALYVEYADRDAVDPITTKAGSASRFIYTGAGSLVQLSHLVSKWEPAARIATVSPALAVRSEATALWQRQSSLGLTRYVNRHRIKLQSEVQHNLQRQLASGTTVRNLTFRLSSEVGF